MQIFKLGLWYANGMLWVVDDFGNLIPMKSLDQVFLIEWYAYDGQAITSNWKWI